MALHARSSGAGGGEVDINPLYVREEGLAVPCDVMPPRGMLPDTALQVVRDELIMDGNARLNLATFVTTWMEPQARQLMTECLDKNMIDKDEYPQTAELERRCVNILASLWHAPGTVPPGGRAAGRRAAGDASLGAAHAGAGDARRRRPRAARPPAPARRACSAGWPCCGAGGPAAALPDCRQPRRTWSWAATSRCAGRSSAGTGR